MLAMQRVSPNLAMRASSCGVGQELRWSETATSPTPIQDSITHMSSCQQ